MLTLWSKLSGYKTYIVVLVSILYAVVIIGWQQHDWNQASLIILNALGLAGIRNGIASNQPSSQS